MPFVPHLRKYVLGISSDATDCDRRGFLVSDPNKRRQLETIGRTFVDGYHAALSDTRADSLGERLDRVDLTFRGFAFEGAAMGLGLLDLLTPWKPGRLDAFLRGPGDAHAYMVHVGAGWAAARIPWARAKPQVFQQGRDPLLCWLAVDGYGFHEGYFSPQRYVRRRAVPRRLAGYARRAFDQGLGRSLWFVEGMDVRRVVARVATFPAQRHGDLWSGLGLAVTYAGGADPPAIDGLVHAAGDHAAAFAQGAAFAAKVRQRAANPTVHTEMACRTICNMTADGAAAVTDESLASLAPGGDSEPAYEQWRRHVQAKFASAASERTPVEQLES